MAYPLDTDRVLEAAYPDLEPNADFLLSGLADGSGVLISQWLPTDPTQPSEQLVNDWKSDATALPSGQLYSEWDALNGGDPDITARDQATRLYDEISRPGAGLSSVSRLDRATMRAIIDEFNRHSACDFAGLHVQDGGSNLQAMSINTETRVTLWTGVGESFRDCVADADTGVITIGKPGNYRISLSASYTHTGGGTCDLTWKIRANGQTGSGFSCVRATENGVPGSISIGPYMTDNLSEGDQIDVAVIHEETTDKNLIFASSQLLVERLPTINERDFDQLRSVVLAKLELE